jgi:leucyl-tRNA synthetase
MIIDDRAEAMQLNATVQAVEPTAEQNRILHKTIKAVTNDLEQMSFNTAIARMMEFTNFFLKCDVRPKSAMERFVLLLSPFAPHLAEELWQALHTPLAHSGRGAGGEGQTTLAYEPWPTFDESAIREDTVEVPVQINGKLRWRIQVPTDSDQPSLEAAARADAKVAELLAGKTVVKAIVVPGRLVNFVVK